MDTEAIDAETNAEYVGRVLPVIATHGGRFLVRTGDVAVVHGDLAPKRLVLIEFDSLDAGRGLVDSAEYSVLDGLRRRGAKPRAAIVEWSGSQA